MITITIANRRGGAGKTVTAHALGSGLSIRGYKVLLIDLDSQGNLTFDTGIKTTGNNAADLLLKSIDIKTAIHKSGNYDIIPASPHLSGAEIELVHKGSGREFVLKKALKSVFNNYDFCIIDTPPSLGEVTINALCASDYAIITAQPEIHSINGLYLMGETLYTIHKTQNTMLKILGILLTRYNGRSVLAKDMKSSIEGISKTFNTTTFKTAIRECISIKESQACRQNIFNYAPKSNAAHDYNDFINEVLERIRKEKAENA